MIPLLQIRYTVEKVQREANASVLSSLKCKRPWIKSSALLLFGVKEPGHDKGDPEDNKSGCGGSLLPSFSVQTAAFLKSPPKALSKGNCMVLLVTCHQKYFTCISIMHKKSEKKIISDFFVDKDDYAVSVWGD